MEREFSDFEPYRVFSSYEEADDFGYALLRDGDIVDYEVSEE